MNSPEAVLVIGVDCATKDSKVGLAMSRFHSGRLVVMDLRVASAESSALAIISEWILDAKSDVLLALDAPLGWPIEMGAHLKDHQAGERIMIAPNEFFRRETDRFVQRTLGKTPLDVGADRIARTAHAALKLLGDLREHLEIPVPLAWEAHPAGVSAIEVYPAATLLARGYPAQGYKNAIQRAERERIARLLESELRLECEETPLVDNADILDSVICALAGKDFITGRVCRPLDEALARREGWIWTAPPSAPSSTTLLSAR